MFDFFNSRKGNLTFSFNNNLIHSSFDPVKEAEKFVKIQLKDIKTAPALFIITNPGLNYIFDTLKTMFQESSFIIIHSSDETYFKASSKYNADIPVWYPSQGSDIYSFLKSVLKEIDLKGLQILNWAPASNAFYEVSSYIEKNLASVIREFNGNINTTNYFGKRYFKNIINNALSLNKTAVFNNISKPVFITSSGPSLEKSLNLIKNKRNSLFLISLSSSLTFLLENDIIPDLFLTTDPGFYSTYHIKKFHSQNIPIAQPMTSYHHPSSNCSLFLINQNTMPENIFLNNLNLNLLSIPQNGTVSGTALLLALSLSEYPVFFSGLDFCSTDIKSHCNPDEFSISEIIKSSRFFPYICSKYKKYSENYSAETGFGTNRTSVQLKTYSTWFNSLKLSREVFRINSSEIPIDNFINITQDQAQNIISGFNVKNTAIEPSTELIDKKLLLTTLNISISNLIESISRRRSDIINRDFFNLYYNDILYYYSASVYLDIYGDFINGNIDNSIKKYKQLIDEAVIFFKHLKGKIEHYE